MLPFKIFFNYLRSTHRELSFTASPTSLRPHIRELGRGGGKIRPSPSAARSAKYPNGARVEILTPGKYLIYSYGGESSKFGKNCVFSTFRACSGAAVANIDMRSTLTCSSMNLQHFGICIQLINIHILPYFFLRMG